MPSLQNAAWVISCNDRGKNDIRYLAEGTWGMDASFSVFALQHRIFSSNDSRERLCDGVCRFGTYRMLSCGNLHRISTHQKVLSFENKRGSTYGKS